ncbi:MAG: S46 family peptidase, partial [Bacteroidales bacterium]|nr:S46 family peptidase [Bacteroidales bacterium]
DDEPASARDLPSLRGKYVRAKYRYLASKGVLQYPDANSTMRLTYGRVLPIKPRDAVSVSWQSTAAGLREKYNPANYDFALPKDFVDVLPPPGFPVNFLTDNDITGGNSGSPVMNAKGELIGLAFDGNKESLASNYESVPGYNMCVCVDIRYVFWVVRYLGKQDYILAELGL